MKLRFLACSLILIASTRMLGGQTAAPFPTATVREDGPISHRADWMRQARWGVMTHFLAEWIKPEAHNSAQAWNDMVNGFDVEGLADRNKSTGDGY